MGSIASLFWFDIWDRFWYVPIAAILTVIDRSRREIRRLGRPRSGNSNGPGATDYG